MELKLQHSPENEFMKAAIEEAWEGVTSGHGGPFGAVIVRDGEIIGRGHNRVLADDDPTSHGEIAAIRDACKNEGSYDISGSVLYTTGEPCPMCLFACLWANVSRVYYGCTLDDNASIGFRDEDLEELIRYRGPLADYLECIDREACLDLFELYLTTEHTLY